MVCHPFGVVFPAHFKPAFDHAMGLHQAALELIAALSAPPSFDDTVAEMDRSGCDLQRVPLLFHNLTAGETSDALRAVQTQTAPCRAAHDNAVFMHVGLITCMDAVAGP